MIFLTIMFILCCADNRFVQIYRQISMSNKFFRTGSSRTKEFRLAKTMMALVVVFILLNMPRLILGLIEAGYSFAYFDILHILLILHIQHI